MLLLGEYPGLDPWVCSRLQQKGAIPTAAPAHFTNKSGLMTTHSSTGVRHLNNDILIYFATTLSSWNRWEYLLPMVQAQRSWYLAFAPFIWKNIDLRGSGYHQLSKVKQQASSIVAALQTSPTRDRQVVLPYRSFVREFSVQVRIKRQPWLPDPLKGEDVASLARDIQLLFDEIGRTIDRTLDTILIDSVGILRPSIIKLFLWRHRDITHLTLCVKGEDNTVMPTILPYVLIVCTSLKSLSTFLSPDDEPISFAHLPLETLTLQGTTPTQLRNLPPLPPTLTSLRLWDHFRSPEDYATYEALEVILPIIGASLKSFTLTCTNDYARKFHLQPFLRPISQHCPNLRFLAVMSGCEPDSKSLADLARGCPDLQTVKFNASWDHGAVMQFLHNAKALKEVSLTVYTDACDMCGGDHSSLFSLGEWEKMADGKRLKVEMKHYCPGSGSSSEDTDWSEDEEGEGGESNDEDDPWWW